MKWNKKIFEDIGQEGQYRLILTGDNRRCISDIAQKKRGPGLDLDQEAAEVVSEIANVVKGIRV